MKKVLAAVLAAGTFIVGAGAAMAASWQPLPTMASAGVQFHKGQYRLNNPHENNGSFEWSGYLADENANDGHNVYMQVRVSGHDWVRYYGKQRRTVFMRHSNFDGAELYTNDARLRACRDRGSLHPDNCSDTFRRTRNLG
ncbi:hypothetical protein ACF1AY_24510 [Streptomyces sp. NPDC014776]|uniref:hypothetical protein n=1 Tax=unclassified Streptomyces TaxID=2593676 RepID=UPI0036F947C3